MTTHEKYQSLAARWEARGRPSSALLGGYSLIALRCWNFSAGAKNETRSELLQAFVRASEAAQHPDWLDAYFSEQETCQACGESYRFENVSLCTACSRTYCYRCASGNARAANGNAACSCGNGELVG